MENNILQHDIDKIKFATFNLSRKGKKIKFNRHLCSKYLKTLQILFKGQFQNWNSRKALLSGFNMKNGNLIGKTSYIFIKPINFYAFEINILTISST